MKKISKFIPSLKHKKFTLILLFFKGLARILKKKIYLSNVNK